MLRSLRPLISTPLRRFTSSTSSFLPLSGCRVLDLSRILAGPFCTQILGDYGAEILKIELPSTGDDSRTWGPPFTVEGNESVYFLGTNRNKKSIGVNLRSVKGRDIILNLAKQCDILVENYLPGKLTEMGLGYEDLSRVNDQLIYVSISGHGDSGPMAQSPGYDLMAAARGGLVYITGEQNQPAKAGVAITDLSTGVFTVTGILAALLQRQRTGKGCYISNSLLESQVSLLGNIGANYLLAGREAKRWGTAHESIVPYQAFKGSDGQSFIVGALNNKQFQLLCEALQIPHVANDEKFSTNPKRVQHRQELIALLSSVFQQRESSHWLKRLEEKEIPSAPINSMKQVFDDPQVIARECVVNVQHPTAGPLKLVNPPIKVYQKLDSQSSASESAVARLKSHPNDESMKLVCPQPESYLPPPRLNEHTRDVLSQLLGYSSQQLDQLEQEGVIGKLKESIKQ